MQPHCKMCKICCVSKNEDNSFYTTGNGHYKAICKKCEKNRYSNKYPYKTIWKSMVSRCHNKHNKQYNDYGGRGIVVCEQWRDSTNGYRKFTEYCTALFKEKKHPLYTLDRIDNNKGYSPENCRVATKTEQNENQRKRIDSVNRQSGVKYIRASSNSDKWLVEVNKKYIGRYKTIEEAVEHLDTYLKKVTSK